MSFSTNRLRTRIFSGSLKSTVKNITDVVFYIAFSISFACGFLGTTMFTSDLTDYHSAYLETIYQTALVAALVCGCIELLFHFRVRTAVFSVLLVAAGIMNRMYGGKRFLYFALCVLIVAANGRSMRRILSIGLMIGTLITAIALVASQAGIIEDLIYNYGRHSFGFSYCTDCAAHIFFLMTIYVVLRLHDFRAGDYLVLFAGIAYMMFTKAKTDILCAGMLVACVFILQLTKRWRDRRFYKRIAAVLSFSFLWCAAFSFAAALFVNLEDDDLHAKLDRIDRTLYRRMELSRKGLSQNPFSLFGSHIRQIGYGGKTENLPSWDTYNFIDCSYIRLYIIGGCILFLLLLAAMTYVMLRCYVYRRYDLLLVLTVVAVNCIMEHHLQEFYYNLFPLMALADMDHFRRTGTADAANENGNKNRRGKEAWRPYIVALIGMIAVVLLSLLLKNTVNRSATMTVNMDEEVEIQDPVLEKVIRKELQMEDTDRAILVSDALELIELVYDGNAHDDKIKSLEGLSAFRNLETIDLHGNVQIDDLTPLEGLEKLESLDLHGDFMITDLTPLRGLKNLQKLNLEKVYGLESIAPLRKLTRLKSLNLNQDYRIGDLSVLAGLKDLQTLHLSGLYLDDIAFLSRLTFLTYLDLSDNRIEDLRHLKKLKKLTELNLYNNDVSDISPLKGLRALEELDLGYNRIEDISALRKMDNMRSLILRGNRITDISSLSNMKGLTVLDLTGNTVTDISSLDGMTGMEELSITESGLEDISVLGAMTGMRKLELRGNRISDISPLAGMTEMEELGLAENQIRDISPLRAMTSITRLDIWNNKIRDISPLAGMSDMDHLEINDNRIKDVTPLSGMSKLRYLEIDGNRISEIDALASLEKLEVLYLGRNRVTDTTSLEGLEKLFWLDMGEEESTEEEEEEEHRDGESAEAEEEQEQRDGESTEAEPDLRIISIFTGMDSDGDAVLLQSGNYNLLMDTGNLSTGHVVQTLKEMGIRELDIYLSHWHDDHYGQITNILQDDDFTVGKVYLPESSAFTALYDPEEYAEMPWWKDYQRHWNAYLRVLDVLEEEEIEPVILSQGSTFPIGSATAEVIYQNTDPSRDDESLKNITYINNTSLVTMVTSAGGVRYLTCGDIEEESEDEILRLGIDIDCDLFKMNHHSADTSNTEDFLESASPIYAFYNIKEKKFNRKPYFTGDTVTRLMKTCNVFSGATNGDITFSIYGTRIEVSAQKRTKTETVVYTGEDGTEDTVDLVFNEDAPVHLPDGLLPADSP